MHVEDKGSRPPEGRRFLEVERSPRLYAPSRDEKKRGKWVVVFERKDEYGEPDVNSTPHIVPTIGWHHEISDSCWCSPQPIGRGGGLDAMLHQVTRNE